MSQSGSLSISVDPSSRIIHVDGEGFWTGEQVARHFDNLSRAVAEARTAYGRVRVFVDLRRSVPQSQDVAATIVSSTMEIYHQADCVALVVTGALQKIQMKRLTRAFNALIFDDAALALAWLDEC
ncbi:MAG: hypothetical protein ABW184_05760 [Sphingobium sp.]